MSSPFSAPPGFGWPPHLQDYLKAAERAMGAGDVTRAMQISAEAAQRGIEHPGMLALAVHHFLDLGQFQQAFRYATRARELAPRQGDVLNALGQTLVKLDRPREAINLFDEALRYSPASFASHFNKAEALVAASELKKARDQYLRALALKPEHVETLTKLAHLAAQRGDAGDPPYIDSAGFHPCQSTDCRDALSPCTLPLPSEIQRPRESRSGNYIVIRYIV